MDNEILEYSLPTAWANYLINGEDEGLPASEVEEIDTFLARERITILSIGEDEYFAWTNDAFSHMGATCATYYAIHTA